MKQYLIGKCLEDFEKWLTLKPLHLNDDDNNLINFYDIDVFWKVPELMQWGVIHEFFITNDIQLIKKSPRTKEYSIYYIEYHQWRYFTVYSGIEEAIKKAVEIYNNK